MNDLDKILNAVGNGYRLYVLGDMDGWIEDRLRGGITSTFRVPGENDKGRRVKEFYAEKGFVRGNTYFEHRSLPK